ncbi:hypothetical protein [Bacillus haynesii]|uniref:hypothetical protein n=1 Tax=Bacillus haynesii TaxID=1925021 RepID=UPI0022802BB8|nr:hypothetical protein [Bacillus haynesii]MCY9324092.1 hypothetical protein [Bacillus haynesii]
MFESFAGYLVDNFGLDGYFRIKAIVIFLTGALSASFLNTIGFANTFKKVWKYPPLKKVALLDIDAGDKRAFYCSPPSSRMEAVQTLFYMWFVKMGFLKKGILIRNNRRIKTLFLTIIVVATVLLIIGLYLSFKLIFVEDEDRNLDFKIDIPYRIENLEK